MLLMGKVTLNLHITNYFSIFVKQKIEKNEQFSW